MAPDNGFFLEPHILPFEARRAVEGPRVTRLDPAVLQAVCGGA